MWKLFKNFLKKWTCIGYKKKDKGLSQEYEKDRTVKQKRRKRTPPRSHLQLWWIYVRHNDQRTLLLLRWRKVNNDEKKEAEYPNDNYPVDIEEGVSDRKDDKNERKNE